MVISLTSAICRACVRPWTSTFEDIKRERGHGVTLVVIVTASLVGLGLSWLIHHFAGPPAGEFMGLAAVWVTKGTPAPFATWGVLVPVGVVYGFYTFEVVLFIFARLLKGRGSFGQQSYAQCLFYAPLAVVQQVLAVLPGVGLWPFGLVALYSLIPTTTSLKAVHGFSTIRAIWTWVLPILLNVIVSAVVVLLLYSQKEG